METVEELESFIERVSNSRFRARLLALGEARAGIRREGQLPRGAPAFPASLDTNLSEYAFSMLRASLALRERQEGSTEILQKGFRKAGKAFEALVRNGSPTNKLRGFWCVMGAAAYHLAGYAAMAFSLMAQAEEDANLAPAERAIRQLLLRNLEALRVETQNWLCNPANSDEAIRDMLLQTDADQDDIFSVILTSSVYRAFSYFEFALLTGDTEIQGEARNILLRGLHTATAAASVTLWWIIRVALNLIDDLWTNSLHRVLPEVGPDGAQGYNALRELFVASLYVRKVAEVELWPSQLDAARRSTDLNDDLVVSLPTSAGKTRIAEICALMSLSVDKRVLLVTPLRALSAQTERSFRKTFGPLGYSVSALYGASGAMPDDQDALGSLCIVIATPEKLDFALRSDPQLIGNVGLIVLDEGHMIGPKDRELRFEILVQRLLLRADAAERRIVCLSAILPDGEQLGDLTAWIRNDDEGEAVMSDWRPTRRRFGTLEWRGSRARLTIGLNNDGSFIPNFVEQQPAIHPRRNDFPKDNRELTIAAAWQFARDGKRTLIFCTQRDHVEGYAKQIVKLGNRGFINGLLDDEDNLEHAKSVGIEWLGEDHPAVRCLELGVAIHHARLPKPFLREVERLLNEDVLKVTVASPTLAQGLNLNVAVLLVPSLYRARNRLTGEEFANVAGRAGRAFVDLEGLVIHVMFEPNDWRRETWRNLVYAAGVRTLESGLILIASKIINRLAHNGLLNREDAFEYLANNRDAWAIPTENDNEEASEALLEKLDLAIYGLVEALNADDADLPRLIDEALNGSLWARQIDRRGNETRICQLNLFKARAGLIWSQTNADQRRGHFAMSVGLDAGLALDAMAEELANLLDQADSAAISGDPDELYGTLNILAEQLLAIRPFSPEDAMQANWREVLALWLHGTPVREVGSENMPFIEDVFSYRLVWAIEALRTRRMVLGWQPEETITGAAAACLETGVPRYAMALLVRSGLSSRAAAIAAINDQNPQLERYSDLIAWLETDDVADLSNTNDWPTRATNSIWKEFRAGVLERSSQKWTNSKWQKTIDAASWQSKPTPNRPYRVEIRPPNNAVWLLTPDFKPIAKLEQTLVDQSPSIITARFHANIDQTTIRRLGCAQAI